MSGRGVVCCSSWKSSGVISESVCSSWLVVKCVGVVCVEEC